MEVGERTVQQCVIADGVRAWDDDRTGSGSVIPSEDKSTQHLHRSQLFQTYLIQTFLSVVPMEYIGSPSGCQG
jgi:hypothetical protein